MLGPVVNAITIIICSIAGMLFIRNIPERFNELIIKALALSTIYLGIKGSLENEMPMLLIMSLVLGTIIGEAINIDRAMNRLGKAVEKKMGFEEGRFAKGFITASLIFCTGSMAIVGSLQSGLIGNHEMLFAKSILDGTFSVVFASQMGIGVAFSSIPVFIYQGGIALGASLLKDYLTPEIIREMSAVGSLLIAAIGFNFLEVKNIRVANMIPAMFIPWIYFSLTSLFNAH